MMSEKTVLITGASKGIGYQLALMYAEKGFKVLAIARTDELLLRLKQKHPERIHTITFDIARINRFDQLLNEVREHTERIDVLVNNAGILVNKPFRQMNEEDFDLMSAVNYKAPFFLTQLFYDMLIASDMKQIVNIGSIGGINNSDKFPGLSIYSSSKGSLAILTECLAKEFNEDNVSVNCLALGAVETEMLKQAFPGYVPDISPEKMAEFIVDFSLSNKGLISGKIIPVAGSSV